MALSPNVFAEKVKNRGFAHTKRTREREHWRLRDHDLNRETVN